MKKIYFLTEGRSALFFVCWPDSQIYLEILTTSLFHSNVTASSRHHYVLPLKIRQHFLASFPSGDMTL